MAELRDAALQPDAADAADSAGPPRRWPPALRGVRAAAVFLSRVPLGGFPYRAADWRWAPAHFPLVGAGVGAGSALSFWAGGALGLGPLLSASLAVATSVCLTGALHEDGLADSADGLGGAYGDPRRALAIMKDSRIGSYGAVALVLSLLVRVFAIAELGLGAGLALVYVHCVARAGPVWLMATQRYVADPATSKSSALFETGARHVATALGWALLCTALASRLGDWPWQTPLAASLVLGAVTALSARYFRRAVGGVTGDLLGATEQLCEIAAWLALLATLQTS